MTFNNIKDENNDDIAIIGMGFRFPGGGSNPDQFWNQLSNKMDGISKISQEKWSRSFYEQKYINNEFGGVLKEEEWKNFDPLFFGISPKEAPTIDPQQRLLMTTLWEAFEDANIKPSALRGSDTAVFIGMMNLDYQRCQFRDISYINPYTVTGSAGSFVSNRLSFSFDLRGPSMTLDTACSSSLNAVYLGCQAIATGDSKMAIVGGVNGIFDPSISMTFSGLNMLGHKGQCRSFDAGADGYIRSEGGGVCILKKYSDAIKDGDRIYCVIKGGSSNVDGYNQKTNITQPSMKAQGENIDIALKKSGVKPSDIFYIEAHGTGTPVGDPIEIEAISKIFKDNHTPEAPLYIGSVKSNIGHLESAAGIASLIKVALSLKNRSLVPNIHFEKPNPLIKFDDWNIRVVTDEIKFPTDKLITMGINCFGLSGSNCHMILSEAPINHESLVSTLTTITSPNDKKEYLIPFSANCTISLDKYIEKLISNQSIYKETILFKDFVKHQTISKSNLIKRKVITASNWDDFLKKRNETTSSSSLTSTISAPTTSTPVIFVFTGQGPQWRDMGKALYETEQIFKNAVDHCDSLLENYFGYSILKKLRSLEKDDSPEIHHPILAQPSIFLIQFGLVALYKSFGISPSIVVGHSFGEVPSALFSGVIDLETAAKIVYYRSTAQNLTIGTGRLLSIGIGAEAYLEKCSKTHPTIEIACYNDPNSIVITGSEDELLSAKETLTADGVFCAFLGTPCSFHSSKQEMIKDKVFNDLSDLPESKVPSVPFFSTVIGTQLTDKGFYNAQYIYDNLRMPVDFTKTISNIFNFIEENESYKNAIFLEIGPHPTLGFYIPKCKPSNSTITSKPIIISPLHKKKEEISQFKLAISSLYCNGVEIDFANGQELLSNDQVCGDRLFKETTNKLPRYQWDFEEYWDEPNASKMVKRGPSNNLLGHDQFGGNTLLELFIDVNKSAHQYLKGHKIKGKYLFPGAGYIDNILRQFNGQDITIFNLEFSNPFFLKEGVQHHLQTSITPTTKGEYKVEFFIKDNRNSTKWTKTSNGRIGLFKHNPKNNKLDIDQLKRKCSFATLTKTEVYNKLLLLSLPYGPTFQRVESCQIGDGCSFFKLSMTPCSEFDKDFLNPSILDCAFHGLLVLSEGPQEIVFDRLQDMKFYSSNVPSTRPEFIYAYAKFDKIVGNSTHGSVDIMLEDGTLLITIKNVKCTSLIRLKKQSIKYPSQNVYSHHWQTKDSPLSLVENQFTILSQEEMKSSTTSSKFEKLLNDKLFNDYLIRLLNQSIKHEFKEFNYKTSTVDTLEIDQKNTQLLEKIQSILKPIESLDQSIDLVLIRQTIIEKSSSFSKELYLVEKSIKRIVSILKGGEGEHFSPSNPSSPNDTPRKSTNSSSQTHKKSSSGGVDDDDDEETDENQQKSSIDKLINNEPFTFSNSKFISNQNQLTSKSIVNSFDKLIKSIENGEKKLIKILDLSSISENSTTLSKLILSQLNQLIINHNENNIEIEYTIPNSKNIETLKEEIKSYESKILNIKYRGLELQDDLESQGYLLTNYDLVITSLLLASPTNVDSNEVLSKLYKLLLPKGQLILIEPPKDVLSFNLLFANESQQSLTIKSKEEIETLIRYCGFIRIETNQNEEEKSSSMLVIQAEKRGIESMSLTFSSDVESLNTSYRNCVFIVSKEQKENPTKYIQEYMDITEIFSDSTTIVQADDSELITNTIESLGKNDIIFFLVSLEKLTIENYKQVTMQYTLVNQILLRNNLSTRFVLLTSNSQNGGSNYLGASLVGTYRYFLEFPSLNILSIDVDESSIENLTLFLRLVDPNTIGDRETIVRDNKVLVQKIFKEPSLLSPSSNYEKDTNNLYMNTNSNLDFAFQCKEQQLPNGFVEIKVMSTGINYKDNLFYRGLLPQEIFTKGDIYSPPFGLECAGYITRVAPGVNRFKVGDQVVGFASHSLSSHVTTHQDKIVIKPDNVSFTEAAAVCVVYATSYYAVFHVGAFMTDKESILVHSATGGVGLATLNLLKWKRNQLGKDEIGKEASIYATVGSKEKVDYLQEKYGDLITTIYNSRDTEYCDEIKQQSTQGGVDLILNTLSGDYLSANFRSLSQVGRIMDLSVTQLVENDSLDFSNFKYHVGYNTIDLERASKYNSKVVRDILTEVFDAIADGSLENIPVKVFPATQVKTAIEYINERVHIGKIVVDFQNFEQDILKPALQEKENPIQLNKVRKLEYTCETLNNTMLITGQTGIAIHIMKWIISGVAAASTNSTNKSLTDFIVLSRSSMKWELENLINQTKHKYGDRFRFHYKSVNVADFNATRTAIDQIYQTCEDIAPIKSILHFATVYEYILPEDITQSVIDNTHNPKAVGAINLHNLSIEKDWKLENFILFSSIGAIIGGSKQSAYSSANLVLDSLATYRKSIGLAATSINWGGLDAGGVAATDKSVASFLEGQGILLVSLAKILGCLDSVFQSSNSQLSNFMLSSFNTDNLLASVPQMKRKMDHHLTNYQTSKGNSDGSLAESGSVQGKVINTISELLSIHPSKLNLDTRLKDYGIDSLLTVQLKNWIDKEFTKNLFTHLQLSSSSINSIIQRISSKSTTPTTTTKTTTTTSSNSTKQPTPKQPSVNTVVTPTTLNTDMFIPSFKN
ncbi:hypothetical protein RB653_002176 [Dictyostelium firmibasis]|uniref:Uncharacterized protein n=1 Tax=Dictyostelium firmibasis TaxID=79012 RepID=A0AAN7YSE5_9MYCE